MYVTQVISGFHLIGILNSGFFLLQLIPVGVNPK